MKQRMMRINDDEELYWVDSKWGCGAVAVIDGVVVDACPIFQKSFIGKKIRDLFKTYRVKKLGE